MWFLFAQANKDASLASKQKVGSKPPGLRCPPYAGFLRKTCDCELPASHLLPRFWKMPFSCIFFVRKILIFAVNFGRMFTIFKIVRTNFVLASELKTCAADFNFEFFNRGFRFEKLVSNLLRRKVKHRGQSSIGWLCRIAASS